MTYVRFYIPCRKLCIFIYKHTEVKLCISKIRKYFYFSLHVSIFYNQNAVLLLGKKKKPSNRKLSSLSMFWKIIYSIFNFNLH